MRRPPCTPRASGAPPRNPARFVEAVDMGFSLRGFFVPAGQKDPLRGFGSLLLRCAPFGVSLRAMPRPAGLSRCEYSDNYFYSVLLKRFATRSA